VGKNFSGNWALKQVSFDVPQGQVVVLLGSSGSGKSTLLRHVDGFENPTTGQIWVHGQLVNGLKNTPLRKLRSQIGFIFQRFELVGPLSALENVLTGASARIRGPRLGAWTYPKALRNEAMEQLERVGLAQFAAQRTDTLSGGQLQRVAIARALMQHPSILLADEPVSSLDPESSHEVMTLIREIAARDGLTVLCSLHQVELALSWGDRIVGLRQGEVVLDTPTELVTKDQVLPLYQRPAPDAPDALTLPNTEFTFASPPPTPELVLGLSL
jgi:phosphonate transport system ATP-binding protein